MAVVPASTPAAPVSAKIPQVTGQKKNGKNWHENKAAFRPLAGQTSYAKRAAKQKQEAEVKKMEKEMKEEKAAEKGGKKTKAAKTKASLSASRNISTAADTTAYDGGLEE